MSSPTGGAAFPVATLIKLVEDATTTAKERLKTMGQDKDISVTDMFSMQMEMNKLSQMSELSSATVTALNTAIKAMATGIKH